VPDGTVIDELEVSSGLIEILSQQLPGGTGENHENLSWDSLCLGQESN
jgi:hypothetical protein